MIVLSTRVSKYFRPSKVRTDFHSFKKAVSRNEVCTIIISFSCTVSVSTTSSNRQLILWYQPCFGILSNILNIEQFEVDACRTISNHLVLSNFLHFMVFIFYNNYRMVKVISYNMTHIIWVIWFIWYVPADLNWKTILKYFEIINCHDLDTRCIETWSLSPSRSSTRFWISNGKSLSSIFSFIRFSLY